MSVGHTGVYMWYRTTVGVCGTAQQLVCRGVAEANPSSANRGEGLVGAATGNRGKGPGGSNRQQGRGARGAATGNRGEGPGGQQQATGARGQGGSNRQQQAVA